MKGKGKLRTREKEKRVTTEDGATQDGGGSLVRWVCATSPREYVRANKIRYLHPIDTKSVRINPTGIHTNIRRVQRRMPLCTEALQRHPLVRPSKPLPPLALNPFLPVTILWRRSVSTRQYNPDMGSHILVLVLTPFPDMFGFFLQMMIVAVSSTILLYRVAVSDPVSRWADIQ